MFGTTADLKRTRAKENVHAALMRLAERFPQTFLLEKILAASAAQSRYRRRDSFQNINSLAKAV